MKRALARAAAVRICAPRRVLGSQEPPTPPPARRADRADRASRWPEPARATGGLRPSRLHLDGRVTERRARTCASSTPARQGWRPVAEHQSAGDGSYKFAVRAERSGSYRAVSDAGASAPRRVTVVARIGGKPRRHVPWSKVRVGRAAPGAGRPQGPAAGASGGRWRTVDRARIRSGGRFTRRLAAGRSGAFRLACRFAGDRANGGASRRSAERARLPARRRLVVRPRPVRQTHGLRARSRSSIWAWRTSRCPAAPRHAPLPRPLGHRPVIDRGPYAAGREWDLTPATKNRLGFGSTGTVGYEPLERELELVLGGRRRALPAALRRAPPRAPRAAAPGGAGRARAAARARLPEHGALVVHRRSIVFARVTVEKSS